MASIAPRTGYAPVNGLEMYYEIHGSGRQRADQLIPMIQACLDAPLPERS